jgi:hypothetical protein
LTEVEPQPHLALPASGKAIEGVVIVDDDPRSTRS